MKKPRIVITEKQRPTPTQVAINLYDISADDKFIFDTPSGYHFQVYRTKKQKSTDNISDTSIIKGKQPFIESQKYLKNAEKHFKNKTPEGYSDCKSNCRNALMSALKELTGRDNVKQAAQELRTQGILGEREEDFTNKLNELLTILHGIDSKKGSHPPMTENENDAKLALDLTTTMLNYIIVQTVKKR